MEVITDNIMTRLTCILVRKHDALGCSQLRGIHYFDQEDSTEQRKRHSLL